MKETLEQIRSDALNEISAPDADPEELRVRFLGKKGKLTAVLRGMGSLSAEERPVIGQLANEVRSALENAVSISACVLTTESLVADKPDPQADAAMAAAAQQGGMGGMY